MKKISIIIVHYQIESVLFNCLESLSQQDTKTPIEIIVVDNGSQAGFAKRLKAKFKNLIYLKPKLNLGYGAGNNFGSEVATGDILFFLNPDTLLEPKCIELIAKFWQSHPDAAIVAPSLITDKKAYFKNQGSLTLTPIRAIFAHSVIHKLWPHNPIAKKFWLKTVDKTKNRLVEVVPGTAFTIQQEIFESVGRFDESFFLYFEEYDFCKRVGDTGKKVWMLGDAKIVHLWEATTKSMDTKAVYNQSFRYYLQKHFGWQGNLAYYLTRMGKKHLFWSILALASLTLLIYYRRDVN